MAEQRDDQERRRLRRRLVELRNQLHEISGGKHQFGPAGEGLGLEEEIAFLEHIIAFETAPKTTWIARLLRAGYDMPHPDALSDEEIGLEIWQVIQRLSELSAYLSHTEHLSDRALYELLFHGLLREETLDLPPDPNSAFHLDVIGSGSDEDIACWLLYYADEEARREWLADEPGLTLPPHQEPPFERDHLLPVPSCNVDSLQAFLHGLFDADWDDREGPIRLSSEMTHAELVAAPVYSAARVVLETLGELGKVKATARLGNLPRTFVKQVYPHLPLAPVDRPDTERALKVLNEEDVRLLHKTRVAAEDAGLLRKVRGHFSLTRKGASLLDPARAGELYRSMFLAFFRKINLGYFDALPPWPGIQATLAITLWRLSVAARDWNDLPTLEAEMLLPDVIEEIRETLPSNVPPGSALETRLWDHLADFGLMEVTPPPEAVFRETEGYRLTPLFDRFLAFDWVAE